MYAQENNNYSGIELTDPIQPCATFHSEFNNFIEEINNNIEDIEN